MENTCSCARCGENKPGDLIYIASVDLTVHLCSPCQKDTKAEGLWSED